MQINEVKQTREDYFRTQIERSREKFDYCKVSVRCVTRWKEVIRRSSRNNISGPIVCLGTRNGREIDLFRTVFFGNQLQKLIVGMFERKKYAFSSRLRFLEASGKSDINNINRRSVVGVELNPDGKRQDVLVATFDELPKVWEAKFNIVFSNCLDHSYDPYKTAEEWLRVLAPGGYIVLSYTGESSKTSLHDPVGKITLEDIKKLFPGDLIYFNKFGNIYHDVIIKKVS